MDRDNDETFVAAVCLEWLRANLWLPVLVSITVYPSLARETEAFDGPSTRCFGVPLIWNCNSVVSSGHKDIFIAALVVDLGLAFVIALVLGWLLRRLDRPGFGFLFIPAGLALWGWGVFCALALVFRLLDSNISDFWLPDDYRLREGAVISTAI